MASLSHLVRAAPDLVRVSVARHVAYRAEMTIWILTSILPLIMLALWNAVAAEAPIAGFAQAELARYFVATLVCRQLTGAWVVWEVSYDIRMGLLSPQLLRPFHPLLVHAAWMITAMPFRIVILSPLVIGVGLWRPDLFVLPSLAQLALFAVSISLAWVLSFTVQCIFGALAFWFDKSEGLFNMWLALWALLSGYVAPLAFFPEAWQGVLRWLPFHAMLGVPVELLGGFVDPATAAPALALQAGWCVVAWVILQGVWARGLVRYGAFGA